MNTNRNERAYVFRSAAGGVQPEDVLDNNVSSLSFSSSTSKSFFHPKTRAAIRTRLLMSLGLNTFAYLTFLTF